MTPESKEPYESKKSNERFYNEIHLLQFVNFVKRMYAPYYVNHKIKADTPEIIKIKTNRIKILPRWDFSMRCNPKLASL